MKRAALVFSFVVGLAVPFAAQAMQKVGPNTPPCTCICSWVPGLNKWVCACICEG